MQSLDPLAVYSDADVLSALRGTSGDRRLWVRYDRLDSSNVYIEPILNVLAGTIDYNALADIKRTAKFTLTDEGGFNFLKDRIRPWVRLGMPDGGYVEWPQGVFVCSTPKRKRSGKGGVVFREVQAYDQLLVLSDDRVVNRYTIASGVAYTTAIATLVAGLGFVAAITPSALTLPAAMEWEPGTTRLRILNDLLGAINYESAWFDEIGRLVCRPYQSPALRASEYDYATDEFSVISGDVSQTLDLFKVPNSWVLTVSEPDRPALVSTYTNVSPSSPTSTVSRGRTITDFRTEQTAANQTTLDAKVARLAFEASQVFEIVEFSTAIMPIHSNADVYSLDIGDLAIDSKFSEHTWTLPLKAGALMSHKARRVVSV